jgi:hypothetical protein
MKVNPEAWIEVGVNLRYWESLIDNFGGVSLQSVSRNEEIIDVKRMPSGSLRHTASGDVEQFDRINGKAVCVFPKGSILTITSANRLRSELVAWLQCSG